MFTCILPHAIRCVAIVFRAWIGLQSGRSDFVRELYCLTRIAIFHAVNQLDGVQGCYYLTAIELYAISLDVEPSHSFVQKFQTTYQQQTLYEVLLVAAFDERYPFRMQMFSWTRRIGSIITLLIHPFAYAVQSKLLVDRLGCINVVPVLIILIRIIRNAVCNEVVGPYVDVLQSQIILICEYISLSSVQQCLLGL